MTCDRCEKPATVHLTQVVNGQMQKMHLCQDCANELGVTQSAGFSMSDILLGQGAAQPLARGASGRVCAECGLTFARFRKQGRLGCPACYEAFETELDSVLRSMHHAVEHEGRRPRHRESRVSIKDKAEKLEAELAEAVASEAYEEAARLRDELETLRTGGAEEGAA